MSLNIIVGLMGAGKSYIAVNWVLRDELKNGKRHVYTTLPLKVDSIARAVGGKSLAKQNAIAERIHILEDALKPVLDSSGAPIMKDGGQLQLNEARCFWRFTKPNSLIIVDECADYWEAGKAENKKLGVEAGEFGVYLRQHRHYKDDLWMICHNLSDVDPQLRRKFHYVWTVANSRNEPIVDNKWFRNIRWPVQFFIVRQYSAADVKKPMDTHHVQPLPDGYDMYDSFSAASRLPGKEMPPEEARSADYKPSLWGRVKEVARALRKVAMIFLVLGVGGYIAFYWILAPALGFAEQGVQSKARGYANGKARPAPLAVAPAAVVVSGSGSVAAEGAVPENTAEGAPLPEKRPVTVVFRSPRFVRYSDGLRFAVGNLYEGKQVTEINTLGIVFDDGSTLPHGGHAAKQ
jgi:zona occludens toxin (predicted ATPase)